MNSQPRLYGVVVPIVTPINSDETVDEEGLKNLVQYILEGGVHGIFVMGTTGEFPRFTIDEWRRAVAIVSETIAGKIPLYVGVSDTSTQKVIQRIEMAEDYDVSAVVITPPFYYPLSDQNEIILFYRKAAEACDIPVIVYNIPSLNPTHIHQDTWKELFKIPGIYGLKDSSGDIDDMRFLTSCARDFENISVFVGDESLYADGLLMGADGVVPSLGNVAPRLCVSLYDACIAKDMQEISELFAAVKDLGALNSIAPSSLGAVAWKKKALELMGICKSHMTQPFWWPEDEVLPLIREKLEKYNLI